MATSHTWRADWVAFPFGLPAPPTTPEERQEWEKRRAEDNARRFDAHVAEVDGRAERERAALEAEQVESVKDDLRRRYLAIPGTTLAGFEREYPALLAAWQREAMHAPDALAAEIESVRRDSRYARF